MMPRTLYLWIQSILCQNSCPLSSVVSWFLVFKGWFSPGQVFVLDEYCARYGVRGCHRHLCYLNDLLERAEQGIMIDPTLKHYSFAFCASHVHGNRLVLKPPCVDHCRTLAVLNYNWWGEKFWPVNLLSHFYDTLFDRTSNMKCPFLLGYSSFLTLIRQIYYWSYLSV